MERNELMNTMFIYDVSVKKKIKVNYPFGVRYLFYTIFRL
jgi:hypothetical protein